MRLAYNVRLSDVPNSVSLKALNLKSNIQSRVRLNSIEFFESAFFIKVQAKLGTWNLVLGTNENLLARYVLIEKAASLLN